MNEIRVGMTGGGTGGHIYPLIAVSQKLQELAGERGLAARIRYFGKAGSYAAAFSDSGVEISSVVSSKLRRYFSPANVLEFPKFIAGFFEALFKLLVFMPDVLFSKGGPGALAVILAARFYRIPVIIHESDSVPGLTGVVSARFAQKIAVAFAGASRYFREQDQPKIALLGNPIRSELLKSGAGKEEAKESLGFNPKYYVILALGGSQGSTRLNEFLLDNAEPLAKMAQVLHQTGVKNYGEIARELKISLRYAGEEEKKSYRAVPYLEQDMKTAMTAADLIVSRAGAGAIFEIAALGKPSILIPLTESAKDHQKMNAYEYSKTGAAVVIEEENLLPHVFQGIVFDLINHPEKLKEMGERAGHFSKPDAAENIAKEIFILALR